MASDQPALDQAAKTYIDQLEFMGELVDVQFEFRMISKKKPSVKITAIMFGGWGSSVDVKPYLSEKTQQSWCSEIETAIREEETEYYSAENQAQLAADDKHSDRGNQ